MKRLGWILAVLALGAAGYFFWFRAEHYVNLPPLAGRTWLAFGDSLTSGYGASEGHDYPTLLGAKLGVKIINQGRAGETSQDGLARIDQTILLDPRVVLICFGGNDTLQAIPREQTIANVGAMVDRFVAHGSFVVLIGIRSASVRDKNESLFKSLAREKQILYVPNFLKGVFGSPDLMSDYVHPNDTGYEFVATRLEGILQPFMPQL